MEKLVAGMPESNRPKWDFLTACSIMKVNPTWFVDERSLELVEMYLFNRPNPSQAFPVSFDRQPHVWTQAKIILDGAFPLMV